MLELMFLILGIAGLWFGSKLVITGALSIVEHYKISQMFIGLTVLALGTDLPEVVVHITGAIHRLGGVETSGLIVGETIGTCFGQIGLALGIAGLSGILIMTKRQLKRDGLALLGSVALIFLVGLDGHISRTEGIVLILIYLVYFLFLYREEKVHEKIQRAPKKSIFWLDFFLLIVGFALLIYSSNLTVGNALLISQRWGITQSLVGILIVGVGTSLPELATSLSAVKKGAGSLAVGNLIGSNIYDALFALGIGSAISGFNVNKDLLRFDIPALFVFSLVVLVLFKRKMRLERKEAFLLIGIYAVYYIVKIVA